MDTLSDVLALLKPRSFMAGGLDVSGELSVQFPRHEGIKCYAAVSGCQWLIVEGLSEPVRINTGDCFLLPRGRPFRLASDPALEPVDFRTVLPAGRINGGITVVNGGGSSMMVGGHFILDGKHADILLDMLPPIVHIKTEADKATLLWSIERMMQELREPQPGSLLVTQHLATMMLVQALRLHLAEGFSGGIGWLFALADEQMSAAINAMHDDPAHGWTLQELAKRSGMSRSSFAMKFKDTVGMPPMDYLTRWRMLRAGDRLIHSNDPISVIALAQGYDSESAFSSAFKRVMGCSPRQYGTERDQVARADEEEKAGFNKRERAVVS